MATFVKASFANNPSVEVKRKSDFLIDPARVGNPGAYTNYLWWTWLQKEREFLHDVAEAKRQQML